jgi:isopentenyl phosphate kinase
MPPKLLILKLGGSAITYKDQFETLNEATLHSIAKRLHERPQSSSSSPSLSPLLILIHGAGSFGHFQAKQYNLSSKLDGVMPHKEWALGLCLTRNRLVRQLAASDPYSLV